MKVLWLAPLALIACAPAPAPLPDVPAGPVAVPFNQYAPAPQPLPEDVALSLPPGIPPGDVFVAPDGCYFFLAGEALMILTEGTTTTPLCRAP
jgi:hypothetical protein